jgi:hypothetical protein
MSFGIGMPETYTHEPREEGKPGIKKDEEENSSQYREEIAPVFLARHAVYKIPQSLNSHLHYVLEPTGDKLHLACGEEGEKPKNKYSKPCPQHGVCDRKAAYAPTFFNMATDAPEGLRVKYNFRLGSSKEKAP